jgi:hypothetical protein
VSERRNVRQSLCPAVVVLAVVTGCLAGQPALAAAAPVTITTVAEAGPEGGVVYATATLAGGDDPTGTVTFRLFGPGDHTCVRPPTFTSTNPVTGAGDPKRATSDRYVLPEQGVYHFVATYSGDSRNAPAGPSPCGDVNAAVGFALSYFSFSAQASPTVALGGTVFDTATIAIASNPTGTITFDLFGPSAPTCTGTPVFTSSRRAHGDGSYTSDPFRPTATGTYRWVARYTGDADDPHAVTSCGDPAQQVEVRPADPSTPGIQCTVRARPVGGLAALLQDVPANPLAALLGRLSGATACRAALPTG